MVFKPDFGSSSGRSWLDKIPFPLPHDPKFPDSDSEPKKPKVSNVPIDYSHKNASDD